MQSYENRIILNLCPKQQSSHQLSSKLNNLHHILLAATVYFSNIASQLITKKKSLTVVENKSVAIVLHSRFAISWWQSGSKFNFFHLKSFISTGSSLKSGIADTRNPKRLS